MFRTILNKKESIIPHQYMYQLIFKQMFLKVEPSDFSEIFNRGNYILEDSFKTTIPISEVLWT